tara:strand:+ start:909 stop:1097 length:189 start_codon:yes stop_codon:yes gene_type:complete
MDRAELMARIERDAPYVLSLLIESAQSGNKEAQRGLRRLQRKGLKIPTHLGERPRMGDKPSD